MEVENLKHYKAIIAINSRLCNCQQEIEKIKAIPQEEADYAGSIFGSEDIYSLEKEIAELTVTIQVLLKLKD